MAKNAHITAFKKHINLLGFIIAVIVTLIAHYGLVYILSLIRDDIMWTPLTSILTYFKNTMIIIANYAIYGLLINSVLRFGFKKSSGIISLSVLRLVLIHLATLFFGLFMSTDFIKDIKANISYIVTEAMIEFILLGGALLLIVFLRKKYADEKNTNITLKKFFDKNNPLTVVIFWVSVLISVVYLAGDVASTLAQIAVYGAENLKFNEIITLATPYIEQIFVFLIGYAVMVGIGKWLDIQWENIVLSDRSSKK